MPKMNNSLISVIVPVYNRVNLVDRAVQSVLKQTYRHLEVIVVDDGSTDNLRQIVEVMVNNDNRVRYLRHEKNKGAAVARNRGILAARGKYIAFQDSDDEWVPEKLEKQIATFDRFSEAGAVYSGYLKVIGDNQKYCPNYPRERLAQPNIKEDVIKACFVALPTLIVKKIVLEDVGLFDESLPRLQDWELIIRLSKKCQFVFLDEPLVCVYGAPGNISSSQSALLKAYEIILLKHRLDLEADCNVFRKYLINLAVGHLADGDYLRGKEHLKYLLRRDLVNWKIVAVYGIVGLGKTFFKIAYKFYLYIRQKYYV